MASVHTHRMSPELSNLSAPMKRWERVWGLPGLTESVSLAFSERMTRSAGRARPSLGRITLAARLTKLPRPVLLKALCHEFAHVAAFRLHGRRAKPHGPEWRSLVEQAGYVASTRLLVASAPRPPKIGARRRVACFCPVCGAKCRVARSSVQHHCRECFAEGAIVPLQQVS